MEKNYPPYLRNLPHNLSSHVETLHEGTSSDQHAHQSDPELSWSVPEWMQGLRLFGRTLKEIIRDKGRLGGLQQALQKAHPELIQRLLYIQRCATVISAQINIEVTENHSIGSV